MTEWMWLVLLYGVLKGLRDIVKKKALKLSNVIEVLFFYTLFGFILLVVSDLIFGTGDLTGSFSMDFTILPFIFIKSFIIFIAWLCSYAAITQMPISLYGVMDLARVLFATLLGVIVLGEDFTFLQGVGLFLVMLGLFLVNLKKSGPDGKREASFKYTMFALISCLLNAVSGIMDKLLMKRVTSGQLQFWYMLFLLLLYFAYLLWYTLKKEKINWQGIRKNFWIPLLSILFMIGDRALFVANGMADSRVTVMTLIKQSCVLITILGGWLVFKEKNIGYRLICAAIVVAGIVIATMGA